MPNQPGRDHDTLIELVQIIANHVKNFEVHSNAFTKHEIRDQANFDELRRDILSLKKGLYIGTGMILAVEALPKLIELIHVVTK